LCAAPYYFNEPLARAAIEAGVHFSDLGGNTEIVWRQRAMDAEARARGVTVVPDVGLAPGLANVLAAEGIRRLDRADEVRLYVGGLPQHPEPPLYYQVVYSLEGVLDYYTTPSWILRDGRRVQVESLSEVEPVEFEGLGRLEAFHTAGGISTLPWTYEGKVGRMAYKTLRYPGHVEIVRAIRDLGLLDTEPVEVKGVRVVPRDLFLAVAGPRLTKPEMRDLVALRVEVTGRRGDRRVRQVWECVDRYDEATGLSAMERTTGFTLSIVGLFLARGVIAERGVRTPDEVVPADPLVAELGARGVRIAYREEPAA
jgi:lysine 6-dehydrogenase